MFLNYLIVKHFLYLIRKQTKRPVIYPVLNISKEGITYYPENRKAEWGSISEIQIIDSILSVTVDFDSKKDFKLNLFNTDLQKQMKQEDFEKLLEYYYKKKFIPILLQCPAVVVVNFNIETYKMKTEITLYKSRQRKPGYVTIIFLCLYHLLYWQLFAH